jgi:hypothetical protein
MSRLTHRSNLAALINHLIGASQQRRWDGEPERLGRLEVDHQLEFIRRLDRQVLGF